MHALLAASTALASLQHAPAAQALTVADVTPEIAPPVPLSPRYGTSRQHVPVRLPGDHHWQPHCNGAACGSTGALGQPVESKLAKH